MHTMFDCLLALLELYAFVYKLTKATYYVNTQNMSKTLHLNWVLRGIRLSKQGGVCANKKSRVWPKKGNVPKMQATRLLGYLLGA